MRFSQSFLDEIRDRVPISSVVGQRVSFDRKKSNPAKGDHWACCPFHGEKTPSFHCEDRKGRYHCFGCGVSGDHFRFLTELDGLPFPEAVERIAEMAGVPMPAPDPQAAAREEKRATLSDVMALAAAFFQQQLQGAQGAHARAYLRERGLGSAVQARFGMGYAPDSRNALKSYLADKGIDQKAMEACGVLVSGEGIAVSYDRFRDRIMFPIEDTRGRVIAFGGRAMNPEAPAKYLNSPETELFHKSRVLFNHGPARRAAQSAETLVAVEGYVDVIALSQAGIEHAVAPLGTALTEEQLDMMWRITAEPILCFDGDEAGRKAAYRAADLALPKIAAGRSLRFALLPDGKDPDDLIRSDGADALKSELTRALPLADILFMRETAGGAFNTPERRAELERGLFAQVGRIGDETVRRFYGQDMRRRLNSLFGGANRQSNAGQGGDRRFGSRRDDAVKGTGRLTVSDSLARSRLLARQGASMGVREAALVMILVTHPALVGEHFEALERLDLGHGELTDLLSALMEGLAIGRFSDDDEAARQFLVERGLGEILAQTEQLVRRARFWPAEAEAALDDAREAFRQALHLHQVSRSLNRELRDAEAELGRDPTDANYRHFLEIQRRFRDARATEALLDGFGLQSGRGKTRVES
ncbi:DNA primase [Notoacmeibacter sp. MSK16QG-6]|uniref:DNA primase n=1 Tax=Notoacmeibacter sp. MSK16QG-6 TaxID=2957982 RepID=UPI00209F1F59|nr:DNA primase [Notoacmeibacter sp. MSK16QG-6]MCP1199823.1 DNA primase [Notoacmeibacter sp. MSK16QG-6]